MRYNLFSNKATQQPVRVTIHKAPVKEDEETKETRAEPVVENEIIDSVAESLRQKACRLLDKIKGISLHTTKRPKLASLNDLIVLSRPVRGDSS